VFGFNPLMGFCGRSNNRLTQLLNYALKQLIASPSRFLKDLAQLTAAELVSKPVVLTEPTVQKCPCMYASD